MTDRQFSAGTAFRTILASANYLAVSAALCMVVAAILPVAAFSARLGDTAIDGLRGVAGGAVSASGATAGGAFAWLALLAFLGAAAARYVRELAPFRRLIDLAAFGCLAAAVVWSLTKGPLVTQMRVAGQVSQMMQGMGTPPGSAASMMPAIAVSLTPGIGCLFVILAPLALVLARRRESAG